MSHGLLGGAVRARLLFRTVLVSVAHAQSSRGGSWEKKPPPQKKGLLGIVVFLH
jgi:hypothetical protein